MTTILPPVHDLRIIEVTSRKLLDAFIDVPDRIHADDPHYVTPLKMERRALLQTKQNPYFEHAEAKYWLAEQNGRFVGRISAQIDQMAIQEQGAQVGHFGMLACKDDPKIAHLLFEAAENWLRERGMTKVQGPMNLSINQEVGLLTEGFNSQSMMLMPHDKPYLQGFIESAGYLNAVNLLAYLRDADTLFPDDLRKLAERPSKRISLRKLNMKNYRQEIETVVSIFNEGWHTNWGFVPMTSAEVAHMASELRPIIDPELACFVEVDGTEVAFFVCVPDINDAIRDLKGKLFPFGWLKLIWRLKIRGPKTARVMLMGVRKQYAGGMLGKMIPFRMIYFVEPYLKKSSLEQVEMSWILEDNMPVRNMIEKLGGKAYKKYQVFEKEL